MNETHGVQKSERSQHLPRDALHASEGKVGGLPRIGKELLKLVQVVLEQLCVGRGRASERNMASEIWRAKYGERNMAMVRQLVYIA